MPRKIAQGEPITLPPDEDRRIRAMIAQAEDDLDHDEMRVNFRWGRPQVAVIERAARLYGLGYQTYLKHVVFRQALQDLKDAQVSAVGGDRSGRS